MTAARIVALLVFATALVACHDDAGAPSAPAQPSEAVLYPDLTRMPEAQRAELAAARERFEAALEEAASDEARAGALGELGNVYLQRSLLAPAESCFARAAALQPQEYRWRYSLAFVHEAQGDLDAAARGYEEAVQSDPRRVEAEVRLGRVLFDLGRMQEARTRFEHVLQAEGRTRALALLGLGRIALEDGDNARARDLLLQALEIWPDVSRVHYPLALAYRGLGEIDKAREHMARYRELEGGQIAEFMQEMASLPTNAAQRAKLGRDAFEAGRLQQAESELRAALAADPGFAPARLYLSRTLAALGREQQAQAEMERAIEQAPDEPAVNYYYGLMLERHGDATRAREHLERAVNGAPENELARMALADVLMNLGEREAALRHYRRLEQRHPDSAVVVYRTAMALAGLGRYGEAQSLLLQAVKRFPRSAELWHALARLGAAAPAPGLRDGATALKVARGLYDARPSAEYARTVAMALAELGRFDAAVAMQRRAIELAGGDQRLRAVLNEELGLYAEGRPNRRPWRDDAAVFHPPVSSSTGAPGR